MNKPFVSTVEIGSKTLIYTQTIFVPTEEKVVSFTLHDGKQLVFTFDVNDKEPKSYSEGEPSDDGSKYNIKLFNYSNLFGEGFSTMPFYLDGSSQYYLSVFTTTNENKSRLMTVTIVKD